MQGGRPGFNPWVGKRPWRRERLPVPVSGLENSMDCIVRGVSKSWIWLNYFQFVIWSPNTINVVNWKKKNRFPTLKPVILTNWLSLVFQGSDTFIWIQKKVSSFHFSMYGTNVFRISMIYLFWEILITGPMDMPSIKNECFSSRCLNYTFTL